MKCFGARTSGRSPWGGRTARRRGEGRAQLAACKILGSGCEHSASVCGELSVPLRRANHCIYTACKRVADLLCSVSIFITADSLPAALISSSVKAPRHQSQSWRKRGGARDDDDDDTCAHAIEQRCARRRRRDRCRAGYGRSVVRCRGAAHPHRSRPARRACCFGHKTTRCCASRPTCGWTACTIV